MKEKLKDYVLITLGMTIAACAIYFFMEPNHVTVGSVVALAMVLAEFVPLPVSLITLILNGVLLLVGVLLVGREFGGKTVYCAALLSLLLAVLERVFPDQPSLLEDPFLDMLAYIVTVSIGQAVLFSRNASSGGLDIVAKLLNKFFRTDLGTGVTLAGLATALSAIAVYDSKTVILALLGTWLNGIVLDHFIFGMNVKKRVCIISEKEEEIKNFILRDLHSGATIYQATGAYDNESRREIITIVTKQEYVKLMDYIEKTDKHAFVTVYTVNEISYVPKPKTGKQGGCS